MSKNPIKDYQRGFFIDDVYIVVLVCENEGKKKAISMKERKDLKHFLLKYFFKNKLESKLYFNLKFSQGIKNILL